MELQDRREYKCNSTTYGSQVLSMKERECGISWTRFLEVRVVRSSSKIFLNGMED